MKKWPIFLSVILLLVAVFLRFYKLGVVPVALYWDEMAILVDAKAIAETGQDMHGNSMWQAIFPSYGDYKLPVYIWLASLSIKLFGINEWAVRLPSAIAGISTILLAGSLIKKLFPQFKNQTWLRLAVITVIAVAPWSVMFSRTAFEGHVAQFLVLVSVGLMLKKQKWGEWSSLAALVGGLATYTYFSVRFIWPVLLIAVTLLLIIDFKVKRSLLDYLKITCGFLVLPLIIYLVSLKPMYNSPLYEVSNQFRLSTISVLNKENWPVVSNQYKLLAGNNLLDKITYHPYVLIARELAQNYADNMSADFLFLAGDPNLRHGTGQHGLFLWIFLPSFIYGWYKFFPKYWRQGLLFLIWWVMALLPASVPETTPHALRTLNALVPLSLVIAWGSYWLITDLNNWQFLKKFKLVLNLGLVSLVILVVSLFADYLFKVYPTNSAASWQAGYKELAEIVAENKNQVDMIWIEPFDNVWYLWLMGYQIPVSAYQDITFNNYKPQVIDNVRLHEFDWAKIKTVEPKTIVAGKKELVDKQLSLSPVQPTWYKTITTVDGETPLAIIYFEQ